MTICLVIIILTVSVIIAFLIIHNEKMHCDTLYNVSLLITDIKNTALFSNFAVSINFFTSSVIGHLKNTKPL